MKVWKCISYEYRRLICNMEIIRIRLKIKLEVFGIIKPENDSPLRD